MTRTTFALIATLAAATVTQAATITIKATNKLPFERKTQTVELKGIDLAGVKEKNLERIKVKDSSGKELITQAVGTDSDTKHGIDTVIFQADFGPNETKTFTVSSGPKRTYKMEDFKAFGRFVRERADDFAWENDRIAHRTYGKALSMPDSEGLISSSIDIWSKNTPRMVINEWYMLENYHADKGEGADFYSAGTSCGCGGDGIWAGDKLHPAANFVNSHSIANGPIRVSFDLIYDPFDAGGVKVSEVRHITLDGGSNLDHIRCTYTPEGEANQMIAAIGLRKTPNSKIDFNTDHGTFTSWETVENNHGMQGVALIADPKLIQKQVDDEQNHLLLLNVGATHTISYETGFFWDKTKQFDGEKGWSKYIAESAQEMTSPIEVTVGK